MEIQARFTKEKFNHSQDNLTHLVISLKAPSLDWVEKRPAVCVVPVVDLSGSMQGPKLEYAKKSLLKLGEQLQPGDILGLVTFNRGVSVPVPPQEVTPELKAAYKKAVQGLVAGGGTNLCAGLLESLEKVQNLDLGPQVLKRVVVFTDGQPTEGITDQKAILSLLEKTRASVTVSTFGYGTMGGGLWNGCDQDFMLQLSTVGQGNYAYVQNPDDALAALGKELGGLLSSYAQNIRIEIEPLKGHQIVKVLTKVPFEQDVTGQTEVKAAEILSEEVQNYVFDVNLKQQKKAFPRQSAAFNIVVHYSILTESGKRETRVVESKAKAQFVRPSEAQVEPDRSLDEIVALAQVVDVQLEAEKLAKKGEYSQAAINMTGLAEALHQRGLSGTSQLAASVSARLGNAAAYANSAGYLRSTSSAGTRAYGVSSLDSDALRDLAFCNLDMGNTTMTALSATFTTVPELEVSEAVPLQALPESIFDAPPPIPSNTRAAFQKLLK